MIYILYTLATLFLDIEPLNTILFNYMVETYEILQEDDNVICKPSPIISNSKAYDF